LKIRCIIIDDEPLAHGVLEKYISKISSLELVYNCYNAEEAISFMLNNKVELLFLDIKMPGLTGLQFLDTLTDLPNVIITSAYSEFALAGYDYSVVDYILKPISFERFLKAVNKLKIVPNNNSEIIGTSKDFITFRADKKIHKMNYDKLLFIKGYGNFVKVFNQGNTLVVAEKLSELEVKLPQNKFARVHKSYIVALDKIDEIDGNRVVILKDKIPIGQTYKSNLIKMLG
jgi:DNA-binding LytR/AlgR family response regulator